MIRCGAALELEPDVSLETLSIGQPGNSLAEGYEMETAGTFLLYTVALRGAEVHVSASLLDSTAAPEHLLRAEDNETGWRTAFHLICSMEKYRVQSLARPIVVGNPALGDPPEECWIVG
jgi:hypothetical protein